MNADPGLGIPTAPEMEAEFEKQVTAIRRAARDEVRLGRDNIVEFREADQRGEDAIAALHRWHREQVERARKAGYLAASGGDIFGYEEAFRDD